MWIWGTDLDSKIESGQIGNRSPFLIVCCPFRASARAQDIAGIEDCTRTSGLDKRTGCFQSNVNFLQRLVTKNELDAAQRLKAAEAEIVAGGPLCGRKATPVCDRGRG